MLQKTLEEFKTFALRGNAIDLAVGVVIGAAFNQVTTALANNILTPPIARLLGGVAFEKLAIPLGGTLSMQYGLFLQALLNFFIIAFALFLFVKVINKLMRRNAAQDKKVTVVDSPELAVLKEIRDAVSAR